MTTSTRKRIIPHKRKLFPVYSPSPAPASVSVSASSTSTSTSTRAWLLRPHDHKTINPSAIPAIIQLRRPIFSSLDSAPNDASANEEEKAEEKDCKKEDDFRARYATALDDSRPGARLEFNSSLAPQPFLEPEMVEERRRRRDQQQQVEGSAGNVMSNGEKDLQVESTARRRGAARSVNDYGSMAVRDRMTVSGRGRRLNRNTHRGN